MGTAEALGRLLLQYRLDSGVAVVTVTGELDVSTSGLLREGLLRVVTDENHRGLVENLARGELHRFDGHRRPGRNLTPGRRHELPPGAGRPVPPGPRHLRHHGPSRGLLGL